MTHAPPLQTIVPTAALGLATWLTTFGLGLLKCLAVALEKGVWRRFDVRSL